PGIFAWQCRKVGASMWPRSRERGNERKNDCTDCNHCASMWPRSRERGNLLRVTRRPSWILAASMWPRSRERGNDEVGWRKWYLLRSLRCGRAHVSAETHAPVAELIVPFSCFNVA